MSPSNPRFRQLWQRTVVRPYRQVLLTEHPGFERFFARRCTHLAGMIAYFAILSIIPAAFLFLSVLAWMGLLETQGFVMAQIAYMLPEQAADTVELTIDYLRARSGSLGVIGAVGLIWAASNFFSCVESALNIVYGVQNRRFLRQKAWVIFLMAAALIGMTLTVVVAAVALPLLEQADGLADTVLHIRGTDAVMSVLLSTIFVFVFLLSCYRFLPNTEVHLREVWRGALGGAALIQVTIHVLPLYLARSDDVIVLKAFAGALILLVWFYVMALILLAGAVFNWWWAERHRPARGLVTADEYVGDEPPAPAHVPRPAPPHPQLATRTRSDSV